jgi:hypothetical protein
MSLGGVVVIVLIVVILVFFAKMKANRKQGWSTGASPYVPQYEAPPPRTVDLDDIRRDDPDFSRAIFEDFAYAIYSAAHLRRALPAPPPSGHGAAEPSPLDRLAPYLSPQARQSLANMGGSPVEAVVIGQMKVIRLDRTADGFSLRIEYESNVSERTPQGERAWWERDVWTFFRRHGAKSRTPERARTLDCPNCGAALDTIMGAKCRYCSKVVDTGAFDWVVTSATCVAREGRGPMLTGTTEEVGTDRPLVLDEQRNAALGALQQRDPQFSIERFKARIGAIFSTMQVAWSSLEWERARPYLSDNLFEQQQYWIDAYRKQGLRNQMTNPRIVRVEIAKVTSDRWYDAITVRMEATGCDYTVRVSDNAVVGGNARNERRYAEYWTLLRSVKARGPSVDAPNCPNCGAPLANVNMAGNCGTCKVKVNSGEFDWVLARIEQDEVYAG